MNDENKTAGILMAAISFGMFSFMDVLIKIGASRYAVPQVLFFHTLFSLIPILAYAAFKGGIWANIRTQRPGMHALRACISVTGSFCAVYAYSRLPIADAYALGFAAPLFITALSVPILKEQVGWRRWTAVGVGFIGILVMLRPGAGIIDLGAFAALGGALCYSLGMIIARLMRGTEKAVSFAFYSCIATLTVSGSSLPAVWVTPAPVDLLLPLASGALGGAAIILLLNAFRTAPAAVVAPFQYSQMIWGILYGYLFFGDLSDGWLFVGAAIVIGSGLYILYRETMLGRGAVTAVPSAPARPSAIGFALPHALRRRSVEPGT